MKWGLIGLGVGIAAGAAAATLLTPKSGKETRTIIVTKAGSAKDSVTAKLRRTDKDIKKDTKKATKSTKKK